MEITIHLTDEDARVLGTSPFGVATSVHALVRREVRRLGADGATAVEYWDWDRLMREAADPPGLLVGPTRVI